MASKLSRGASTSEVARRAGVHRDTLLRWLRQGLVPEPDRDRRGWRLFSPAQAKAIVDFSNSKVDAPGVAPERDAPPRSVTALNSIDWNFHEAKTNYLTHNIHPYPAKFIPQIPNALIQELSGVGDTVGDIFCGSGTTLVEALTLKRHAVGIDANPLACLIARSKTGIVDEQGADELRNLVARCQELALPDAISSTQNMFARAKFEAPTWRPDFPKLTFWFDSHVIEELALALHWCREIRCETARDVALAAFSSIVVAVSRQDSDTRYVRRQKQIPHGETLRRFARALDTANRSATEFADIVEPRFRRQVIEANLLDGPTIPKLDLVVSSPPYPNAYSYHLYHMTRMIWLGMDQPKFKREEIGSHRKYSRSGASGATAETFKGEMATIFQWLAGYLKRGGFACFVIGNSTIKGATVDNTSILAQASRKAGFREAARVSRTLQATKKAFNPAIGRIKQEQILVLENVGGT